MIPTQPAASVTAAAPLANQLASDTKFDRRADHPAPGGWAAGQCAGPATRQGRKHVGVYVPPDVAHRLRVIAAQEDASTQALIVEGIERVFQARAG